nr:hypothetical protein [Anaerocolumna jejuensis]
MSKAATTVGFLYFVIALIAIGHEIESRFNSTQELLRIFSCSRRRVIIENDGIKSIFAGAYNPKIRFGVCPSVFLFQDLDRGSSIMRNLRFRSSRWKKSYSGRIYSLPVVIIQWAIEVVQSERSSAESPVPDGTGVYITHIFDK